MFRFGNPPNYQPQREDSLAAIAEREGRTPQEVAYDVLLEDDGNAFIYTPLGNYADYDLSVSETTLADRNSIMGLGDGGAHVAFILDAGYQTWLLTHWGRTTKRWEMPELIRRVTSDTAHAAGLHDRGVLAVGKKADVNVIDWDRLGCDKPYVVHDLPAGGKRLMQKVHGYDATIVSGCVTYREWRGDRRVAGPVGARAAGVKRRGNRGASYRRPTPCHASPALRERRCFRSEHRTAIRGATVDGDDRAGGIGRHVRG